MYKNNSKGMTLLEVLVSITIFSILMLTVNSAINQFYKTNTLVLAQNQSIDEARRGLDNWRNDTREMVVAADGSYPLSVASEHKMAYYSDIDQDNGIEYVEYILASSTLTRNVYNPVGSPPIYNLSGSPDISETISIYVRNLSKSTSTFLYYDGNNNQLTNDSLLNIRYIVMRLYIDVDPNNPPGDFLLQAAVAPRNLKDNL